MTGYELARDYEKGNLCGWAEVRHPGIAKEQFNLLANSFKPLAISRQTRQTAGRKVFLHHVARKVLGKDTENYGQEIGDCVSFGAKNATEYLTTVQILGKAIEAYNSGVMSVESYIQAARIKFRQVFTPYYYGTGRVYVGQGRLGPSQDGSLGSWMAEAVMKYGTLFRDESGVPTYSGQVAKSWGGSRQPLDKWKPTAEPFLVKSAALVTTWDDLVAAIANGYPCTTASNIGYAMEPGRDGFHAQTANWGHQMCFVGVDETYTEPYALIVNSWGDAHGRLKDFQTNEDLPVGYLRVRRKDAEKHLRAQETYAFSQFEGFPEQDLDKAMFMLV